MAFASNSGGGPMADINVTPLVDVMLVLLIIFMVTAPTLSYPIDVDLPQKSLNPPPQNAKNRRSRSGCASTRPARCSGTMSPQPVTALQSMMEVEVQRDPTNQPTLEIDTSPDADYGILAKVLAAAKNADMIKIGFVQND